ncbi:MAG: tetratricopeptide repeat-containing sensor histidine kinase [Sediminibacterium sp.]
MQGCLPGSGKTRRALQDVSCSTLQAGFEYLKLTIVIRQFLLFAAFVFTVVSCANAQETTVSDSLLQVAHRYQQPDSIKAFLFRRVFREYLYQNKETQAKKYLDSAVSIAAKLPRKDILARMYERIGITYHGRGDYLNALHYYDLATGMSSRIMDQSITAGAYLNKTDVYQKVSDYANAIDAAERSLKLYASLNDEGGMASCYNNLSITYIALKDLRNAYHYAKKSLPVFEKDGLMSRGVASAKELMGTIILEADAADLASFGIAAAERYETAIQHFRHAVEIATLNKDRDLKGTLLTDIGQAYEKDNRITEAIQSFEAAVPEILKGLEAPMIATNLISAGGFFVRNGRIKQGLQYLHTGLALAKRSQLLMPQKTAFETLSKFYEQRRQYDSALFYNRSYAAVKDSIFNQDKEKEITRKKMALDFSIREQEYRFQKQMTDKKLKEQLLLAKVQKAEINLKNRVGILLGLLALIIFIAAFFIYKSRQKAVELNKTVEAQRKSLEELVLVKDKVFSVVGHDMRSPINSLIAFVQILEHGDVSKEQLAKYAAELGNNLRFTSALMENLLYWAGSQMQGFKPHFVRVNLKKMTDTVLGSLHAFIQQKNIQVDNRFGEELFLRVDKEMFILVLRNLLSNAVKFSFPDTEILLNFQQTAGEQIISITDSGTGLSDEKLAEINADAAAAIESSYGTKMEKGTGLGLMLSKSFMAMMGGRITARHNETGGCTFHIILPLHQS